MRHKVTSRAPAYVSEQENANVMRKWQPAGRDPLHTNLIGLRAVQDPGGSIPGCLFIYLFNDVYQLWSCWLEGLREGTGKRHHCVLHLNKGSNTVPWNMNQQF
jgi:hypothetical protein